MKHSHVCRMLWFVSSRRLLTLTLSALSGILTPSAPMTCQASPLEDLQRSKAMQDFRALDPLAQSKKNDKLARFLKGLDRGTNLASLWENETAPRILMTWGNIKVPFYSMRRLTSNRTEDLAEADSWIHDSGGFELHVTIRIPHPTIEPLVKAGMVKQFTEFVPSSTDIEVSTEIPLDGGTATLYHTVKGACSVLIPVSKSGLINVAASSCGSTDEIVKVIKQFDLVRINRKLNT